MSYKTGLFVYILIHHEPKYEIFLVVTCGNIETNYATRPIYLHIKYFILLAIPICQSKNWLHLEFWI